jgi:hypothetical protein
MRGSILPCPSGFGCPIHRGRFVLASHRGGILSDIISVRFATRESKAIDLGRIEAIMVALALHVTRKFVFKDCAAELN